MPKFVIERDIPGACKLTPAQLRAISQKTCGGLNSDLVQWVQSYATENRIYCVYIAPDEGTVRKHAQQAGFPTHRISRYSVRD